jgi:hypothetical protein
MAGELLFRPSFLRALRLASIVRCAIWRFLSSISLLPCSACSDLVPVRWLRVTYPQAPTLDRESLPAAIPNLSAPDRILADLMALLVRPTRLLRSAIVLKPSTLRFSGNDHDFSSRLDERLQHGFERDFSLSRASLSALELDPAFVEAIKHLDAGCGVLHALRFE